MTLTKQYKQVTNISRDDPLYLINTEKNLTKTSPTRNSISILNEKRNIAKQIYIIYFFPHATRSHKGCQQKKSVARFFSHAKK